MEHYNHVSLNLCFWLGVLFLYSAFWSPTCIHPFSSNSQIVVELTWLLVLCYIPAVYKKAQEIRADLQSMFQETSSSVLKLGGMCNSFKTGSRVCSKTQKLQGTTNSSFISCFCYQHTDSWTSQRQNPTSLLWELWKEMRKKISEHTVSLNNVKTSPGLDWTAASPSLFSGSSHLGCNRDLVKWGQGYPLWADHCHCAVSRLKPTGLLTGFNWCSSLPYRNREAMLTWAQRLYGRHYPKPFAPPLFFMWLLRDAGALGVTHTN